MDPNSIRTKLSKLKYWLEIVIVHMTNLHTVDSSTHTFESAHVPGSLPGTGRELIFQLFSLKIWFEEKVLLASFLMQKGNSYALSMALGKTWHACPYRVEKANFYGTATRIKLCVLGKKWHKLQTKTCEMCIKLSK